MAVETPLTFRRYMPAGRIKLFAKFVVVQPLSCVQLFVTPWTAARQASLSFTISQSLLKLMSTDHHSLKASVLQYIKIISGSIIFIFIQICKDGVATAIELEEARAPLNVLPYLHASRVASLSCLLPELLGHGL